MTTHAFALRPISDDDADALRRIGGPIYTADEFPGFPCRQCLEDAAIGEELILVSHDPFDRDSQYRSSSPIFLHRHACQPPSDRDARLPEQLTRRQLSVRAFDGDAMMIDAAVIDGTELEHSIGAFFDDPETKLLHVHNASRGCWAVTVERNAAD